ncbi:hypothetical protein SIN8267_00152 [Sinobacterium norvegicum]|uniref:Lipoprotein n=1 Tax=Sinobacterium norvegicum TaxID=1641715 RepID=A0ABM9AA25_9GAMM|nr:hypothetical protein [Sinobacterium norvegicum]CAH0990069.1 hypothetical protein SIN8267_00152 [Sinobacterium norvegicum]
MNKIITVMAVLMLTACANNPPEQHPDPDAVLDKLWVYSDTGALQCEPDSGMSIDESADILNSHGVEVSDSKTGQKSQMAVIAMCGGPTLDIYLHQVASDNLEDAKSLGFDPITDLESEDGAGYTLQ